MAEASEVHEMKAKLNHHALCDQEHSRRIDELYAENADLRRRLASVEAESESTIHRLNLTIRELQDQLKPKGNAF